MVKLDGQTSVKGEFTITVKEQFTDWPQVSLAIHVTRLVPTGKVLPLGGLQANNGVVQPPLAELV